MLYLYIRMTRVMFKKKYLKIYEYSFQYFWPRHKSRDLFG